jgi:hypothetical protein
MTNDVIIATDNQMLEPSVAQRPLGERLLELTDADLQMIQGQGRLGKEFNNSFDNSFDNAFDNSV